MGKIPSDEAVKAATGKVWLGWFKILDIANATKMSHTQIAALLYDNLGCPAWWNQMIANQYEQARGLRKKHEMSDGYQVGASKTFEAPISKLYAAWLDGSRRGWLKGDKMDITTAHRNKSIRARWGETRVDVNFYSKGDNKSTVTVGHNKIQNAEEAEKMKAYWKKALDSLQGAFAK